MGEITNIKTGIEQESDVTTADADVFAYADNGEYATVFEIDRLSDTIVRVVYHRCEAGLSEIDAEETFTVDSDKTTEQWARECAEADPQMAIEAAKDYWN